MLERYEEDIYFDTLTTRVLNGPVGVFLLVGFGALESQGQDSFISQAMQLSENDDFPNQLKSVFEALPNLLQGLVRRYKNEASSELYDLVNDPGEHVNLWNDREYMEIKMELLTRLTHRMAFTCDPLPERVGIY